MKTIEEVDKKEANILYAKERYLPEEIDIIFKIFSKSNSKK